MTYTICDNKIKKDDEYWGFSIYIIIFKLNNDITHKKYEIQAFDQFLI